MKKTSIRLLTLMLAAIMLLGTLVGCSQQEEETDLSPSISADIKIIAHNASALETSVKLQNMKFAENITREQVKLCGAFENAKLEKIERRSETEVFVSIKGTPAADKDKGYIAFADSAIIAEKAPDPENLTPEQEEDKKNFQPGKPDPFPYSAVISVSKPIIEVCIESKDNKSAAVTVKVPKDEFKSELKPESFSVKIGEKVLKPVLTERKDDKTCYLEFSESALDAFSPLGYGTVEIESEALNSGSKITDTFGIFDATVSAEVDFVEEKDDDFIITSILRIANGTFTDLDKSAFKSGEALGEIISVEKTSAGKIAIKTKTKKNGRTADSLDLEAEIFVKGVYAKNMWGEEKSDCRVNIDYHAELTDKEILAVETSLLYDLIQCGFKSLAAGAGEAGVKRIFDFLEDDEFAGDETAAQLSKLSDYLQSMDAKWSEALGDLNIQLGIMADKLGKNDCSRVLDDFDTMTANLKSLILHLENKKIAVDKAEKGTAEYEKAVKEFVDAVEKDNTQLYSETYLLGQKIITGASGLTQGIIGTYDEMLSYIYNFDVQTYNLKEKFRVFVFSLYLEAYDETVLYYELTDPDNRQLKSLGEQVKKIKALSEKLKVTRRPENDDYVYCYVIGREIKRYVSTASSDTHNLPDGTYSVGEAEALNMIKRAESRGKTLRQDLEEGGMYTVNRMQQKNGIEYDTICVNLEHHEKKTKTKMEWWVTATTINIDNHNVKRNYRAYYQRQERKGIDAFFGIYKWDQKECWGCYISYGIIPRNK